MSKSEPTIDDVLEAITDFADSTEQRFDGLEKRFDGLETRFDGLDNKVKTVETQMVTKDYLDRKLINLRDDLVLHIQKLDQKDTALVDVLQKKKVISKSERDGIVALRPFSRLA